MKTARFVVFQDKKKQWRWHLVSANGRVIAQGEGHTRKADAERAYRALIRTVKKMAARDSGPVVGVTFGSPSIEPKTTAQLKREVDGVLGVQFRRMA